MEVEDWSLEMRADSDSVRDDAMKDTERGEMGGYARRGWVLSMNFESGK